MKTKRTLTPHELEALRKAGDFTPCERCGHGAAFHLDPEGCVAGIDIASAIPCGCPLAIRTPAICPCFGCVLNKYVQDCSCDSVVRDYRCPVHGGGSDD